jgi:putative peptidoglycan lipid II flippase
MSQVRGRSVARNTLTVMLGTLGSRILGLVRQVVLVSLGFFPTALTDSFAIAFQISNLFRELLAEGALVNSFIPVYQQLSPEERPKLAASFSGALLAINMVLLGLGLTFAPQIVALLTADSPHVNLPQTIYLARLMMPFLTFISLSAIAMGLLNANEWFWESSFAPLAFNAVAILVMLLFPHSPLWLGLSATAGGAAQFLVQLPGLRRHRLIHSVTLRPHPKLGRVLLLMAPFTLTTGARQIFSVFLIRILSQFPVGANTAYLNSNTIFQLVLGLFAVSPALAVYPRMASRAAEGDWPGFGEFTLRALRLVLFFAAPISALLLILAPSVMAALYNWHSGYNVHRYLFSWQILTTFSLALIPWGLNAIMLRTFYVRQRSLEPLIVTAAAFGGDTVLYLHFYLIFGLYGMGLATTLTGWVSTALLAWLYHRQVPLGFPLRALASYGLQVLLAAAGAGLVVWGLARVLPRPGSFLPSLITLAVGGTAGLLVYGLLVAALGLPEWQDLRRRLKI